MKTSRRGFLGVLGAAAVAGIPRNSQCAMAHAEMVSLYAESERRRTRNVYSPDSTDIFRPSRTISLRCPHCHQRYVHGHWRASDE
jgi:hypothetical protein